MPTKWRKRRNRITKQRSGLNQNQSMIMASLPKFRKLSSFTRRIVSHYKRKEKQRRTSDFSFVYSFLCLASFNNTQQIFFPLFTLHNCKIIKPPQSTNKILPYNCLIKLHSGLEGKNSKRKVS